MELKLKLNYGTCFLHCIDIWMSFLILAECYNVSVDFLCIALKRYKMRPLLIHVSVR